MTGAGVVRGWAWALGGVTDAVLGPTPRPRPVSRTRIVVLVVVAFLVWLGLLVQYEDATARFVVAAALLQAAAVPAIWLVGPMWAWRLALVGFLVGVPVAEARSPVGILSWVLLGVLLYFVAATHTRRAGVGAWIVTAAAVALHAAVGSTTVDGALGAAAVLAALLGVAVALGDGIRDRGVARSRLESARAQQMEGLAREAVLRERTHIARELHNVVAHHMSMIALQSEAALLRHPDLPDEVLRKFTVIRDASREGLGEMRRLVGVLRDDGVVERAPQPGVGQIEELVDEARRGGMAVTFSVEGDPRPLPVTIDVTVYRLVQEALSNARRHAPGAEVAVGVAFAGEDLRVRVVDAGAKG